MSLQKVTWVESIATRALISRGPRPHTLALSRMHLQEQKGFVYVIYDQWLVSPLGLTEVSNQASVMRQCTASDGLLQSRSQIIGEARNFDGKQRRPCLLRSWFLEVVEDVETTGRLLQVGAGAKRRQDRHHWVRRWLQGLPSSKRGSWCPHVILVADSPGRSLTFSTVAARGLPRPSCWSPNLEKWKLQTFLTMPGGNTGRRLTRAASIRAGVRVQPQWCLTLWSDTKSLF